NDQLLVLAFNSKIELERIVSDPVQLGEILAHPATGGLTALYDTVYHACDEPVFSDEREPHRSAMILFSDGEDDLSVRGLPDAIVSPCSHDPHPNGQRSSAIASGVFHFSVDSRARGNIQRQLG